MTKTVGAAVPKFPNSKYGYHNAGQEATMTLQLDPAFDQLLQYTECEALDVRHFPVSQDMRQLLYTEQRKYAIQLKVRDTLTYSRVAGFYFVWIVFPH
jgi:hypothetical protein